MATKVEITAHVARKLRQVYKSELDGTYVQTALAGSMDSAAWSQIAVYLRSDSLAAIGQMVKDRVVTKLLSDVDDEAITMLTDDSLSLTEYARTERLP